VSKDNSESAGKKRLARNISKRTSKRRGELAELAFSWKAASLGFTVAKPYGDSDRYDFIVDSGGHLFRMQIKSASRLSQGTYFITTQRCANGVSIPYTSEEIDFLAGYIFPEDAWVIIPVEALDGRRSIHIFPSDRADAGLYASYREAWCQLACTRRAPGLKALMIEPRCEGRQELGCPVRLRPRAKSPGRPRKRLVE
jgi:hypothetical protein